MTVSELISFLKTQPQHLTVVYQCCSENNTLEAKDIAIKELCAAREDGWVPNRRPDKARQNYLALPGN